jgi:hypothetical protein
LMDLDATGFDFYSKIGVRQNILSHTLLHAEAFLGLREQGSPDWLDPVVGRPAVGANDAVESVTQQAVYTLCPTRLPDPKR